MKARLHHSSRSTEWLVFVCSVGLSLTLLFFSQHEGVARLRGEAGDLVAWAATPLVSVRSFINTWQDVDRLRMHSMELSVENGMLRDALFENERLRAMLAFKSRSPMNLKAASVLSRVGTALGGRMRIDAGERDGIEINSAVLTPRGLVGKVVETTDRTALVQTLVGNSYGVSVLVERNRLNGILRWSGPGEWVVIGVPIGADLRDGDLLITSGAGSVFPKGIRAGVVSGTAPISVDYGEVWSVMPLAHFETLEEVFVVIESETPTDAGDEPGE